MSQTAVIIESIIKRPDGSKIDFGSAIYHFAPDDAGRHVATVMDANHIARLLAIPEGFRLLGASAAPAPVVAPAAPVGIIQQPAQTQAPEPTPAPQPAPVQEPVQQPAADTVAKPLNQMTDEELRATFKAELGRAAPPKSKTETMIAQIEAMREERKAAAQ